MTQAVSVAGELQSCRARLLAYLIRLCGNFADAEDICQDVLLAALDHWQRDGLPPVPLAWLYRAARNRFIDSYRRQQRDRSRQSSWQPLDAAVDDDVLEQVLDDDVLKLIFTCCHPALVKDIRVALTLRYVTGLDLDAVAAAFLVSPATMDKRLQRARQKILHAGIAYEVPVGAQLPLRLDSVMASLYLMFNEGYQQTRGDHLVNADQCAEAIRLTTLVQRVFPGRAELLSLLALMLLHHSRRDARVSQAGELVLLAEQDRSNWDELAIAQGCALVDKALHLRQEPGPYQLQAAIAALHAQAYKPEVTDWPQIALLYQRLLQLDYSQVAHLNYAVALLMMSDVATAGNELARLGDGLQRYGPYHLAMAEMHRQRADLLASQRSLKTALGLAGNETQRRFIKRRIDELVRQQVR